MDHEQALARVVTDGADHLDAAIARGRGTVIALPHSGNWDIAALWLVRRGYRFTTVVERVRPESLYNRFVGYRESIGMEVLPLTGAGTSVLRTLTERLRARGVVCLVADRDLSSRGITVDFFGEPTRMPSGPSRLALATGAALVPVHLRYDGDGWGQWIGAPVELGDGPATARVQRGTQQLADLFATMIARHPADWHMLQRLWLADLDPARGEPTGQAAAGGLAAGGQAADGPAAGGQAADLL